MAKFIKANTLYESVNTTLGADSITLSAIAGKDYQIVNTGTGGNTLTINYGIDSLNLADGESTRIFYDGSHWIVGDVLAGGGSILWSITADYNADEVVWYVDKFYIALQASMGNQPDTSPTYWEAVTYEASLTTIADAGGHYTSGNVEGALQEVGTDINDLFTNKLDITAPTVDAEVKTLKVNTSADSASTVGAGTVKMNDEGSNLEFSNGVDWVPVGAGEDFRGFNYDNRNFEVNIDGYITYDDGAVAEPVDGTGGTPSALSIAEEITTPLIGARSLKVSKSAIDGQGEGASYDFSIDEGNLGETVQVEFKLKTSANYADDDMGVYLYDIDNSNLMYLSLTNIKKSDSASQWFATFIPSDSLNYRLIWHVQSTNALAYDVLIDDIQVGVFNRAVGAAIGAIPSYDMVVIGTTTNPVKGTIDYEKMECRRVGNTLELSYAYKQSASGSGGSGTYLFPLPPGLTIDYSKVNNASQIGVGKASSAADNVSATTQTIHVVALESFPGYFGLQVDNDTSTFSPVSSSTFSFAGVNTGYFFCLSVPIAQWSDNINLVSSADEYASNSSSTDADDTTSFVYGTGGSSGIIGVTNIANIRRKRIKFNTPIQVTDNICLELYEPDTGIWTAFPILANNVAAISFGYANVSGTAGGIIFNTIDKYHIDVVFFKTAEGITAWNSVNYAGVRWRVRKSSGSRAGEVPRMVHIEYTNQVTTVANTNIRYTTKVIDTHSIYDTTNGQTLIPISGIYRGTFTAVLSLSGAAAVQLFRNGVAYRYLNTVSTSSTRTSHPFEVYLEAGDIITFQCTAALNATSIDNMSLTFSGK